MEISSGGTLTGGGTLIGAVANLAGTVAPGTAADRLDIGDNYSQGPAGKLAIDIGGPLAELQYDQLVVSGAAALNGVLHVELLTTGTGTFAPTLGQTFDVLKAGNGISGTFSALELPALIGNVAWSVSYLANTVRLQVIGGLAGDFNHDNVVNAADYPVWRKTDGTPAGFNAWRSHFGQSGGQGSSIGSNPNAVPEPASLGFFALAGLGLLAASREARARLSR
jgi:hypothetical protein